MGLALMTMDRFTSDFDRIFADGPAPKYRQCFCVGPQRGESLCPCALAQKGFESGANAAANSPALCTEASPTRTGNPTEIQND